jgi:hypothetical protein
MFFLIHCVLFADVIELEYHFTNPTFKIMGEFQVIEFPKCLQQGKLGEPVLPYHSVKALLPVGEQIATIEIELKDIILLEQTAQLYPKQKVRAYSLADESSFSMNQAIYRQQEAYPTSSFEHYTTEYFCGYSIGLTTFTPVQYIPATQEISYAQTVKVRITTTSSQRKNILPVSTSEKVFQQVADFVHNPGNLNRYSQPNQKRNGYDVLIITNNQFAGQFNDLQRDYLEKGLLSEINTVEEIATQMSGIDLPEKIRNAIIESYQNDNISYVLLAGDTEIIPYRGFFCEVQSSDLIVDDDIPADLYYSALDGTWNDDNDNLWAEPEESDLLPDVAVSRLPFSNLSQLESMLSKTLFYQNSPVLNELETPLMVGEFLYDNPISWGADYLDLLIGEHADNGYETNGIPENHDITTLYDRDYGEWSVSQLVNEINQGHSFIHHSGHSNVNYTMRLYSDDIDNNIFSNVNGIDHNFTLLYTHGCNCGAFDENDCIAEEMLKINNFLVAFIGNSRYGWFNEGQTEGPSAHLHREFVDAMYSSKNNTIAAAHLESKLDTSPWVTAPGQHEEGALRWCFYDCNVLAEPALGMWPSEPRSIEVDYPAYAVLGQDSIEIQVTENGIPAEQVQCSILYENEFLGTAFTDASGFASVDLIEPLSNPGQLDLYITGYSILKEHFTIDVITGGVEYIILESFELTDDNNNAPEYGENMNLSITLSNIGSEPAHEISAYLSADDEHIFYTENLIALEMLNPGESYTFPNAFGISVSDSVPDMYLPDLHLVINSQSSDYSYPVTFECFAPSLQINQMVINDEEGNQNGILDSGETAFLEFEIENAGHSGAENITASLVCNHPNVSLLNTNFTITELAENQQSQAIFEISVNESIPVGTILEFTLDANILGNYETEETFSTTIGLSIEDFESGDFSNFDWQMSGNQDWVISATSYEGMYSAKSGEIGNNQSSTLEISFENIMPSELRFFRKISSEEDYDFLYFHINGELQNEWSGESDWTEMIYILNAGDYTFTWSYDKDGSVTGGEDCAWIDFIIFPIAENQAFSENTDVPIVKTELLGNYPNPFNPVTEISYQIAKDAPVCLEIYNVKGQKIVTLVNEYQTKGNYSILWNGIDTQNKKVASGMYLYRLNAGSYSKTNKMILLK